jgi:rubrerythrin
MASLKGSKTEQNLKDAFAGESMANRRYLYFAQKADVEGFNDVSAVFRSTAEGETGHAHGHLQFLEEVGDPATGEPMGDTTDNLKSAIAGETHEYTDMYPGMARTAREEGFDEIADWFETLAKAEKSHAGRFQKALDTMAYGKTQGRRSRGRDRGSGALLLFAGFRKTGTAHPAVRCRFGGGARRVTDAATSKRHALTGPVALASAACGGLRNGEIERCAKAAWTPRCVTRSTGKTPSSPTWTRSCRRWIGSSTSVTAVAAASICATPSRSSST